MHCEAVQSVLDIRTYKAHAAHAFGFEAIVRENGLKDLVSCYYLLRDEGKLIYNNGETLVISKSGGLESILNPNNTEVLDDYRKIVKGQKTITIGIYKELWVALPHLLEIFSDAGGETVNIYMQINPQTSSFHVSNYLKKCFPRLEIKLQRFEGEKPETSNHPDAVFLPFYMMSSNCWGLERSGEEKEMHIPGVTTTFYLGIDPGTIDIIRF